MNDRQRPALPLLFCALALLSAIPAAPAQAMPPICDGSTALTLIGIDTTSGRLLFSVPPLGPQGRRWVIEVEPDARAVRAYPDPPAGLFSGSVGPGPVIAAVRCGEDCLQPMRWEGRAWKPLGEALTSPTAANVTPTYDPAGAPWIVLQGAAGAAGTVKTWAYRLQGPEWQSRGSMEVTAVGQPSALPAPQRKDGVLCGTGLFSASGHPEAWVSGLPDLPKERRGQLVALTGTTAAYISADGVVYLSDDAGKKWRRSTWTPWGSNDVVGSWRQGTDYWVDLPFGDHQGALRLVWFDRRTPKGETILLSELRQSGWARLGETLSEVRTKSGDSLPVTQVLVPKGNDWILLSGCAATDAGSGLVLRVFDGREVSPPKFVAFTPGE